MSKRNLLLFFVFVVLIVGGVFFFSMRKSEVSWPTREEELLKNSKNLIYDEKYQEAIDQAKVSLSKTQNATEEAHVNYTLAFGYMNAALSETSDTESYKKAFDLAYSILGNESYPKMLRAQAGEIIDRFIINKDLQPLVLNEPQMQRFSDPSKKYLTFRKNFLQHVESIYPLAGVEMRLAVVYASEIKEISLEGKSPNKEVIIEQAKNAFKKAVEQGNASLPEDYRNEMTIHIPGVLLSKAMAGEIYFEATQETPFGTVESLYQEALLSSDKNFPRLRPVIQSFLDQFLSENKK